MKPSEVDFTSVVYAAAPEGWRTAEEWAEVFLIVAAMELQDRLSVNAASPFDESVHRRLDPMFRFDPFRSLLTDGESVGRLTLLKLVWLLVDIKLAETPDRGDPNPVAAYQDTLRQLSGTLLGAHGTRLFLEGFKRRWFDAAGPAELTDLEVAFIEGRPLDLGSTVLNPSGSLYTDSIWLVAFRIVESESPEYFLGQYWHRLEAIRLILQGGAELGQRGAGSLWPGWPGYMR